MQRIYQILAAMNNWGHSLISVGIVTELKWFYNLFKAIKQSFIVTKIRSKIYLFVFRPTNLPKDRRTGLPKETGRRLFYVYK